MRGVMFFDIAITAHRGSLPRAKRHNNTIIVVINNKLNKQPISIDYGELSP